jgi:hypothetical protein
MRLVGNEPVAEFRVITGGAAGWAGAGARTDPCRQNPALRPTDAPRGTSRTVCGCGAGSAPAHAGWWFAVGRACSAPPEAQAQYRDVHCDGLAQRRGAPPGGQAPAERGLMAVMLSRPQSAGISALRFMSQPVDGRRARTTVMRLTRSAECQVCPLTQRACRHPR